MRMNLMAMGGGVAVMLALAACADSAKPPAVERASLPESLFATSAAPDARSVVDLRRDAKEGDEVVITGRIGGRSEPFMADRAMVLISERSMQACGEQDPKDTCKTPWDFCCVDAKEVAGKLATVQVVDSSGKVLRGTMDGAHGGKLKPMAEVVVKGRVSKKDDNTLVIDAVSIFVKG